MPEETSCGKEERTGSLDVLNFNWFAKGGFVADRSETLGSIHFKECFTDPISDIL
jgi:hypothetical protein